MIDGDLYVVGGGDPLLITSGYTSTFEETDQKYTDYAAWPTPSSARG